LEPVKTVKARQILVGAFVMSGIAVTTSADNTGASQWNATVATNLPVEARGAEVAADWASYGGDVDADVGGTVDKPRMYQRIRRHGPIADRQFEIEFLDPASEVFVLTFG
jgi:Thioredoxin like C-terminal domain